MSVFTVSRAAAERLARTDIDGLSIDSSSFRRKFLKGDIHDLINSWPTELEQS